MPITRQKIFSNLIWRFLERTGAQLVAFIVAIVLARILTPEDYGTIALITVFTTILNVFVDSGLGSALVQKKDADNVDFSTVFYTNVIFCIILYAILFFVSPLIADFYKRQELTAVIRVLGITILISGVKNIQQSYVSKTLQFKKFFFATLVGTVIAAIVGVWMAYHGFGVWALVAQQITNLSIDTILLWITVKWYPNFVFSFERLKGLFSFGWKLLVSALIDTTYNNLRQLIIGKKYTSEDLAFYNKGNLFPFAIVSNVDNAINNVLLPVMSQEQDDKAKVKQMTRRAIKTSTYCISPLLMGLAACAPAVVHILLTDKWLPCIPYLRIFCITYMFWPVHTTNLTAISSLGRSDLFLKLEIIKKIMGLTILVSTMWFGVMIMAYSLLLMDVLGQIINSWPNKRLINYSYLEQLKDILPGIGTAVVMGLLVSLINYLSIAEWLKLLIQIPAGILIFISLSKIFKIDSYSYLKTLIAGKIKRS
ncbi:MAG: lipopolysaccharide biosynthesis protein [Treponema sp.]|uniref:lipopolysaccharide biosynthesis protein n=1 Tax=Treponema sp. TaxID=166 RepID=UPI00258117C4|nr:lipopolysaccharide biosynthesis protein [Treponema sp.]MBQ9102608.1 lipopolysaccharide biosynthesis protein [Treponema sp.]